MKISRKDLRKIILESLNEKTLLKEVSLRKIRKALIDAEKDAKKTNQEQDPDLVATLEKYRDDLRIAFDADSGPFKNKDSSRYREAKDLFDTIERFLRSPGPVNVPPISDDNAPVEVPEKTPGKAPEPSQVAEPESEWKKYQNETDWEYQIQEESPNQIWVTRKAGGNGTEYKLNKRRYKSTVRKLDSDSNMPDRTSESIRNDPALSSAPASSASSTSGDQAADTSAVSNNENSTNEKLKKIFNAGYKLLVAIPAGKVTIYTPDGADDPGLYSVKEFDSITNLDAFYQQTSASRLANKNKGSIIYSGIDFYYNQEDKKMYFDGSALNNFSLGPYVTKNLNSGSVAYVLEGVDLDAAVDDAYVKLNIEESENQAGRTSVPTPGLRAAPPASALSEESSISENKVIYGESHATLMRKRYWGRY